MNGQSIRKRRITVFEAFHSARIYKSVDVSDSKMPVLYDSVASLDQQKVFQFSWVLLFKIPSRINVCCLTVANALSN